MPPQSATGTTVIDDALAALDSRIASLRTIAVPPDEIVFSFDLCWTLRTEREPGQKWLHRVLSEIFEETDRA